ncbi:MAG: hypothetical protein EB059_01625 [Alphaproteobacteria bacterium]|nr:hypothetical protein [Alphaproteobacteria bacterium]
MLFARFFLFLCVIAGATPLMAAEARHVPTFSECQKLASKKTTAQEKAQLTQLFKSNGMYCTMLTAPFTVQNIFSPGQTKAQLRLTIDRSNHYAIDGKSLLDVLAPDRAAIPMAHMVLLAGQIIAALSDVVNAGGNPESATHVGRHVSGLASIAGVNARSALQQINFLRMQARLGEDDIQPSFWLNKLALMEPPPATAPAIATPNPLAASPPWMQKAFGGMQNLLGSFQSSD